MLDLLARVKKRLTKQARKSWCVFKRSFRQLWGRVGQIDTRILGSVSTAVGLIWETHTAQLTYGLRGPDNQMRELTTIKWGPSLRGGALVGGLWKPVYPLVEARLSACSLKCQQWCFLPENLPADQYVCFSNQSVPGCDGDIAWMCSSCCFTVNWQFVSPRFVPFHSLGDFYFITIIFFPSRSQNAICHPSVTGTPHEDGLFVSNSMNPWQRCQAMLNAAPIFHASPPSLSPPAEC